MVISKTARPLHDHDIIQHMHNPLRLLIGLVERLHLQGLCVMVLPRVQPRIPKQAASMHHAQGMAGEGEVLGELC